MINKKKKIVFYVSYPYYFPHFLPIGNYFSENGCDVEYVLSTKQNNENMEFIAKQNNLNYSFGVDSLFANDIDFAFFANNIPEYIDKISATTIFLRHGIGTKRCNYVQATKDFDWVIAEGSYRYSLVAETCPDFIDKVIQPGFSKLDTAVNQKDEIKEEYLHKYNLNPDKPVILYAPTFFPSSIEKMSDYFPDDFSNCNIIIKPHYLSLSRWQYKKQKQKFNLWEKFSNCSVCGLDEYDLTPFYAVADIMISDESSAIFEFAALDKPVILNKFLKLRLSYHLNPKKLLAKFDGGMKPYREVGDNANSYSEMVTMTKDNILNKDKYAAKRKELMMQISGLVDGNVSKRIFEHLMGAS
ncbi:MAG: CDP-glycerol--poly(glycerophosphate) glycerophosphotransferase [Bacteroidetes bacterium]|nr:CDP-glycerol--poly(glycerophosphate) glycerophosphotransferase [Bacteroidota bacterium]